MFSSNETCQKYFNRRIKEGWKCISLKGCNAILLSPDGIRRELDLRHDVETLIPNAGNVKETELKYYDGSLHNPDYLYNWQQIDDHDNGNPDPDDDSTYVAVAGTTPVNNWYRDLYDLPAHSGDGTINKITLYFRVVASFWGEEYVKGAIRSNSTVTETAEKNPLNDFGEGNWGTYNEEWAKNPAPEPDEDWTWDDIDALQIGISQKELSDKGGTLRCTLVYVEVDYTPPGIKWNAKTIIKWCGKVITKWNAKCFGLI